MVDVKVAHMKAKEKREEEWKEYLWTSREIETLNKEILDLMNQATVLMASGQQKIGGGDVSGGVADINAAQSKMASASHKFTQVADLQRQAEKLLAQVQGKDEIIGIYKHILG